MLTVDKILFFFVSLLFASVMASSIVSNEFVANKECMKNGIIKCDECLSRFCSGHFPIHQPELDRWEQVSDLCEENSK